MHFHPTEDAVVALATLTAMLLVVLTVTTVVFWKKNQGGDREIMTVGAIALLAAIMALGVIAGFPVLLAHSS